MLKSEKPQEVENLRKMFDSYTTIGVLNMHKLPARQLQKMRQELRGAAEIRMSKKNLIFRAIDVSGKEGIKQMKGKITGSPALIFSNENPFKLFRLIKENRAPASAKAGDIAPRDLVITQGPTGLPPGPAISTLQKVGLKTSVQQGKIAVAQDKVVVKAGEIISADAAGVFNLLKMEPMEIGLDLVAVLEGDTVYDKQVLDIDREVYLKNVEVALQESLNLSVELGWPTEDNVELMVTKAFNEAKSIAVACSIAEKEFIEDIMVAAIREAEEMKKIIPQ
ncbi:MAG: 50S ribosomal protein L10 [Candidatus Aenigmarchaeota archaeon]|nr:50S ribosomal protein L10 [Candidatus Aenigmarchaeota archaeon]